MTIFTIRARIKLYKWEYSSAMTLQISLPKELESLVQNQIEKGMYSDPSEVVSEALRHFFMADDDLTPQKIAWLNAIIEKQEEGIRNGSEQWVDGEAFFKEMEQKYN